MFIGGRWTAAQDEQTLPVIAPANGEVFAQIPRGTAHEVDLAVKAARAALDGAWGRMSATERGRVLLRISARGSRARRRAGRSSRRATPASR